MKGPDGEIGRRSGLKIRRPQGRGGSSPPLGTIESIVYGYTALSRSIRLRLNYGQTQRVCVVLHVEPRSLRAFHTESTSFLRRLTCHCGRQRFACLDLRWDFSGQSASALIATSHPLLRGSNFRWTAAEDRGETRSIPQRRLCQFDRNPDRLHDPAKCSRLIVSARLCLFLFTLPRFAKDGGPQPATGRNRGGSDHEDRWLAYSKRF